MSIQFDLRNKYNKTYVITKTSTRNQYIRVIVLYRYSNSPDYELGPVTIKLNMH